MKEAPRKNEEAPATKPQHTELPWELDSAKDGPGTYYIIHGQLPKELTDDSFGYPVADSMNRHFCISPEEDEANFALIVKSVNGAPLLEERVQKLTKALESARSEFVGLAAYLATCATTTIIENLETTIASLHKHEAEAERVLGEER